MRKLLRNSNEIKSLIREGDEKLANLGFTEHSFRHSRIVSQKAGWILKKIEYSKHDIELAEIAGWMHDIGNSVGRKCHAQYGAELARDILKKYNIDSCDSEIIISAIANHDETIGKAVGAVSSAIIIADKTDIRKSRVRSKKESEYDKHDLAHLAVEDAMLEVDLKKEVIKFSIMLDEKLCPKDEFMNIFFKRMCMCGEASKVLGMKFYFAINQHIIMG